MPDHTPHNPAAPVPAAVEGVDTSDIAAEHVTVSGLFAAVINRDPADDVGQLYLEAAAALADTSATELLDEADVDRMIRLAVVALQDGAGALLALAERRPRKQDPRVALAAALQAEAARTLQALDCEHVTTR